LDAWEAYRDVARLGRKTRIPEPQRKVLWSIFERVRAGLKARHLFTHARLFSSLAASIQQTSPEHSANAVLDGPNNNPIVEQRQSLARSVQASTCLPSASAVRQDHPGAWPSWTLRALGHEGSKCWHPANRVATRNNQSGVPGGSNGVTVPLPGSSPANQRWPQPVPIVF